MNNEALKESKIDFAYKRNIKLEDLEDLAFLESIGATKNGTLNFAGLLFLGKVSAIEKYLGLYEYRFSWRTNTGILIKNDVWNDCVWNTIKKVKSYFNEFNHMIEFTYKDKPYTFSLLDDQAFHEAFLNAIVHRDYSTNGMISINYKGDELIITNPGRFYGGVNEDNISYHEPRHRNKILAKLLMTYQLVDRAGMGVLRISLNSLKYGREFPVWREHLDNIEVKMFSEYIKPAIFVLTQEYLKDCTLTDLLLLNKLNEIGYINVKDFEKELSKIYKNPWNEIEKVLLKENYKEYFLLKGNNKGIYITCTDSCSIYLNVSKKFKAASNTDKHIILFKYLKKHKSANNELIMNLLKFSRSSATYSFLSKLEYVKNTGKSRSSLWSLK